MEHHFLKTRTLLSILFTSCVFLIFIFACNSGSSNFNLEELETQKVRYKQIEASDINIDFLEFLNSKSYSRSDTNISDIIDSIGRDSSTGNISWDLASACEYIDNSTGMIAQMVKSDSGKTTACAYYSIYEKSNVAPKIIVMEDNGDNNYTICNSNNTPLFSVNYNPENNIITATDTYSVNNKQLIAIACNGAMAVLGWEIAWALSVPSGGSSLAFGVLWSVASTIYCG